MGLGVDSLFLRKMAFDRLFQGKVTSAASRTSRVACESSGGDRRPFFLGLTPLFSPSDARYLVRHLKSAQLLQLSPIVSLYVRIHFSWKFFAGDY